MKRTIPRGFAPAHGQHPWGPHPTPRRRSSPLVAVGLAAGLALAAACGGGGGAGGAPAGPTTPPPGPAQPAELTTAEAVLEASIAAQGGRERIGKLKGLRQTGALVIPQMGMRGAMTLISAPPRSSVTTIELPGLGKIVQGITGDLAWEVNPITGARVINGGERAQLLRESTFNADLMWKQLYPKVELAGVVELAGAPAYKVVLTPPEGDAQTRYFAKDTLLPTGLQMTVDSQMGKVPVELTISDWRDVNGIKYAHKLQRKEGPQTVEIILEKIEHDPPLDPATFALPPEIEALQKK